MAKDSREIGSIGRVINLKIKSFMNIELNCFVFLTTGARMLYRYLPRTAGLRRITLHKCESLANVSKFLIEFSNFPVAAVAKSGDKMYLLICECSDLLKDLSAAAYLVPAMRARLCGYTAIYRPVQTF